METHISLHTKTPHSFMQTLFSENPKPLSQEILNIHQQKQSI